MQATFPVITRARPARQMAFIIASTLAMDAASVVFATSHALALDVIPALLTVQIMRLPERAILSWWAVRLWRRPPPAAP